MLTPVSWGVWELQCFQSLDYLIAFYMGYILRENIVQKESSGHQNDTMSVRVTS